MRSSYGEHRIIIREGTACRRKRKRERRKELLRKTEEFFFHMAFRLPARILKRGRTTAGRTLRTPRVSSRPGRRDLRPDHENRGRCEEERAQGSLSEAKRPGIAAFTTGKTPSAVPRGAPKPGERKGAGVSEAEDPVQRRNTEYSRIYKRI